MNHNFEANKEKAAKIMFYLIKVVRTTKEAKDTSVRIKQTCPGK